LILGLPSLLRNLVAHIGAAPASVQAVFNSFVRLTREELWDSEAALRAYVYEDNNYERLLRGEIGINLIQTHTAMRIGRIMIQMGRDRLWREAAAM
jgi:hypothetical protein